MLVEFQELILKYLTQQPSARKYVIMLDADLFDSPVDKQLYKLLKSYSAKYNSTPSYKMFSDYLDVAIQKSKTPVSKEIVERLRNRLAALYVPLDGGSDYIRDRIIDYAMRKRTKDLSLLMVDNIDSADEDVYTRYYTEMKKILQLREGDDEFERNAGGFLFRDHEKHMDAFEQQKIHPFFLKSINDMTAAGGFYQGQNIVFMGGAKRFKTGLLLNGAIDYAVTGTKVFYADTENGIDPLRMRLKQVLLQCTRKEVIKYREEFSSMSEKALKFGGDLITHYFPKGSSIDDIDEVLQYYWNEYGWKPEIIFHDYGHKYRARNKNIRERRFQIQDVYGDIDWLNAKWGTLSFTVSPVSSGATDKWVLDEKDFGEDKAIAYNCHASFAINRTKKEMELGTARITPIVQREGTVYKDNAETTCSIRITEETMQIEELDSHWYLEQIKPERDKLLGETMKKKVVKRNKVKDE